MAQSAGVYDYIIVGAGSSGCVLANRLTREHDHSVLLIEAGGKDDYLWIHIPVGYLYCIDNPRTDWRFRTEADPGLNGRSLIYPRGKVLGGSSSINGMIYMRGQARDYDHWADITGDAGWSWKEVLPTFIKSEDHHGGGDAMHGRGGEWRVERQRLSWEILDSFREAAAQTGIPKIEDFNRGDNEGCAYFEVNQRGGVRLNTARAFLRAERRRGVGDAFEDGHPAVHEAAHLPVGGRHRRADDGQPWGRGRSGPGVGGALRRDRHPRQRRRRQSWVESR